jgi:hypothetical protein
MQVRHNNHKKYKSIAYDSYINTPLYISTYVDCECDYVSYHERTYCANSEQDTIGIDACNIGNSLQILTIIHIYHHVLTYFMPRSCADIVDCYVGLILYDIDEYINRGTKYIRIYIETLGTYSLCY